MKRLTLQDLLNRNVGEIVKDISTPVVEKEKVDVKELLENYFKDKLELIYAGQVIHLQDYFVKIQKVVKASNRVFFEDMDSGEKFSLPMWLLTGVSNFKYKKGDKVLFDGKVYEVQSVNPSNNGVFIKVNGKKRYVSVNKITDVER